MPEEQWTFETLKIYLLGMIEQNDLRYSGQFIALEKLLTNAISAQKEAVASTLVATKEAVSKAEMSAEKRFESLNEFRGQLRDQQSTLLPRNEADIKFDTLMKQVEALTACSGKRDAGSSGVKTGWVLAVGLVAIVLSMISLFHILLGV
jgi:hypothetical protein